MVQWRKFHISVTFRAPLPFAYAWCTDYTPEDGKYAGEDRSIHLRRRILGRTPRTVVFENLYDVGKGWGWERHVVALRPPNAWHCEGWGNYHEVVLDYKLTEVDTERTRFDMTWRSRPTHRSHGPRTPSSVVEAFVENLWAKRARALEREYRRAVRVR